jgi:CheY-like chemotaxis protein
VPHGKGARLRILLAEDNPVNQEVIQMMLSELGYQTDVVNDGVQAVEAAQRRTYDVILMDLLMPGLDGLQASQRIRSLNGGSRIPWIVAVTADEETDRRSECLAAGMNAFLSRPVHLEKLAAALAPAAELCGEPAAQPDWDRASDPQAVRSPASGNHNRSGGLEEAFLADARQTLAKMELLAVKTDFAELRRQAHYLKGSSMVVNAVRAVELCREIETRASTRQSLGPLLPDLRRELEEIALAWASRERWQS